MTRVARLFAHFAFGLAMSLGLGLSGMLEPQKIIGFLDISGDWDPTLVFVMIGALTTYGLIYLFIRNRKKPILDAEFHLPNKTSVDKRLLIGALLFGAGWGLSGLCPGPGLTALVSFHPYVVLFVVGMVLGMAAINIFVSPRKDFEP